MLSSGLLCQQSPWILSFCARARPARPAGGVAVLSGMLLGDTLGGGSPLWWHPGTSVATLCGGWVWVSEGMAAGGTGKQHLLRENAGP